MSDMAREEVSIGDDIVRAIHEDDPEEVWYILTSDPRYNLDRKQIKFDTRGKYSWANQVLKMSALCGNYKICKLLESHFDYPRSYLFDMFKLVACRMIAFGPHRYEPSIEMIWDNELNQCWLHANKYYSPDHVFNYSDRLAFIRQLDRDRLTPLIVTNDIDQLRRLRINDVYLLALIISDRILDGKSLWITLGLINGYNDCIFQLGWDDYVDELCVMALKLVINYKCEEGFIGSIYVQELDILVGYVVLYEHWDRSTTPFTFFQFGKLSIELFNKIRKNGRSWTHYFNRRCCDLMINVLTVFKLLERKLNFDKKMSAKEYYKMLLGLVSMDMFVFFTRYRSPGPLLNFLFCDENHPLYVSNISDQQTHLKTFKNLIENGAIGLNRIVKVELIGNSDQLIIGHIIGLGEGEPSNSDIRKSLVQCILDNCNHIHSTKLIREKITELGFNETSSIDFVEDMRLTCLSARQINYLGLLKKQQANQLPPELVKFIKQH